jgi:hypothetical protein
MMQMDDHRSTSNDNRPIDHAAANGPGGERPPTWRERSERRWENEGGALSRPPSGPTQ